MRERTKMGRRRKAKADTSSAFYQERREAIVNAAASAFLERGYEATTIGTIAERLSTDRATLYYYFGSKQELFREVIREVAQKTVEAAEFIAAKDAPADGKLREAFQSVLETYSSSYPFMHVFLQENFPAISQTRDSWNAEAHNWAKRYYFAIRHIIQQGVDEGRFYLTLPIGVTTMGVLGTVNWAHRWYKPGGSLPASDIGNGFAEMLLNGLAPAVKSLKKAAPPEKKNQAKPPRLVTRRRKSVQGKPSVQRKPAPSPLG